jgi:SAM-dependent methyltransferase
MNDPDYEKLGLSGSEYIRDRLYPRLTNRDCLAHDDLRLAIVRLCQGLSGRVLDYGCGGSPYFELLPQLRPYVRADIGSGPGIDIVISDDGSVAQPDGSFDVVLSTQVLEHIPEPGRYIAESFRLLRPGGTLVLTTHGMAPEHGCPHDYGRWTPTGLARLASSGGFEIEESVKLTAGLRGVVQLLHAILIFELRCPDRPAIHYPLDVLRRFYVRGAVPILNWFGRRFPENGWEKGDGPSSIYFGIALRARKPVDSANSPRG